MKFSGLVIDFIFTSFAAFMVLYFGTYIRLYIMGKKSKKKIFIFVTIVYIIVEFFLVYHFFFRET